MLCVCYNSYYNSIDFLIIINSLFKYKKLNLDDDFYNSIIKLNIETINLNNI